MPSKLFTGAEIIEEADKPGARNITPTLTAKKMRKLILKKYGEIIPTAEYYNRGREGGVGEPVIQMYSKGTDINRKHYNKIVNGKVVGYGSAASSNPKKKHFGDKIVEPYMVKTKDGREKAKRRAY